MMKTQPQIKRNQPQYQHVIDMAQRVPVIAIMGTGGKTTTSVFISSALEQEGFAVQLYDLDLSDSVPARFKEQESPDLIVVNCPSYSPDGGTAATTVCSKIAAAAKFNLITIGNKEHHLAFSFNLLMEMIQSLNGVEQYHYVFIEFEDNDNDRVVNAARVDEDLEDLTGYKCYTKVRFIKIGNITFNQVIQHCLKNGFPENKMAMASEPFRAIVQKLLPLVIE